MIWSRSSAAYSNSSIRLASFISFSNRAMVWAVLGSFLLVLMAIYVPFFQPFFDTVPLGFDDWLLMLPFFFASPVAMELLKHWFRKTRPHVQAA